MNLTNLKGLPDAFVSAVRNDSYVGGGDISATKLIDSPQKRILNKTYKQYVVEDVSERVWSLMGQAVHTVLERAGTTALVEERLYMDVNGWQLSGQFDRLHLGDKALQDWKVTTVFKANGSEDWERQLNVLRMLAKANGYEVDTLQVIAIFRDWRRSDASRNPDYPQASVKVIEVPVWDDAKATAYIEERIALHQAADRGEEVLCSDEERWYAGTTYALIKEGGKRAKKVSVNREDLGEPDKGYVIEERKGGYRRCENFCEVAPFCQQFKSTQESNQGDVNVDTY
jgi:hypothetical protein